MEIIKFRKVTSKLCVATPSLAGASMAMLAGAVNASGSLGLFIEQIMEAFAISFKIRYSKNNNFDIITSRRPVSIENQEILIKMIKKTIFFIKIMIKTRKLIY